MNPLSFILLIPLLALLVWRERRYQQVCKQRDDLQRTLAQMSRLVVELQKAAIKLGTKAPLLMLCLCLAGCMTQGRTEPEKTFPSPYDAPRGSLRGTTIVVITPQEPLIPVQYPSDATNYVWSLYGGPTVIGPWQLLESDMVGQPAGTLDVPGYGDAGFYKVVGTK